ncbi:MAG: ISAs1 family transposase [Chloroflexota bacterium]|nr:ISAs1 family transposase [Chloroflexota bacterium]
MSRVPWPDGFAAFADLHDPRIDRPLQHALADIVVIALGAVVAGADSWVQVAAFGRTKESWLRTFLSLPHGIPSHDTFGRVFALLDPARFAACYQDWIQTRVPGVLANAPIIAVDGKTARRAHDRVAGQPALHAITAWATETGVALGQRRVADHENEITALPDLLAQGAVVTIDAIGCQRDVAATIVAKAGDDVLALKANPPEPWTTTRETFAAVAAGTQTVDTIDWHETLDKGHGRLERRTCRVIEDAATVAWLQTNAAGEWRGLRTLVEVQAWCRRGETDHEETRYYLSSLPPDADRLNRVVRRHWAIENELHWVLDVVFDEDQSRIRQGYAAENTALLRRIALGLLKQETSGKGEPAREAAESGMG